MRFELKRELSSDEDKKAVEDKIRSSIYESLTEEDKDGKPVNGPIKVDKDSFKDKGEVISIGKVLDGRWHDNEDIYQQMKFIMLVITC